MEKSPKRQNQFDQISSNKAFCVIPWLHLHVMPNSTVIPCCVSPYQDHYGDVSTTDVMEIWNNDKFKNLRLKMIEGELPSGCSHCHDLEKAGFDSMREKLNKRFKNDISEYFLKTAEDGTYYEIKLKYIDIRFSNLCNLKCRGCGPPLSSSWYDDWTQLHGFKPVGPKVKSISEDSPGFWKVFQDLMLDAEEVYFGGGEPLITKEHFDVLRLLIAKGKTNVQLSYNTNLSTLTYGKHNLADLWNEFRSITLGISIDDLGSRAEYFRHGTKWQVFESNLFNLRDNYQAIRRYINCTVNITNVFYLPEIYYYLFTNNIMNSEDFNINLLLGPEEYRIDAIPMSAKLQIKEKLESFYSFLDLHKLRKVKQDFERTILHMMKEDLSHLFPKFINTTTKLDQIRNESFLKTYPELAAVLGLIVPEERVETKVPPRIIPPPAYNVSDLFVTIAIFEHESLFKGETSEINLKQRTEPSLEGLAYQVIKENEWDEFLEKSLLERNEIAVIMASGLYVSDKEAFIQGLELVSRDLMKKGWPAAGHILAFKDSNLLPYINEQIIVINLKVWEEIGKPKLGPLFTNQAEVMMNVDISTENTFKDWTPTFIKAFGTTTLKGEMAWGSFLIMMALKHGLGVLNLPEVLWNSIKYAYPRDNNPAERANIDNLIKLSNKKRMALTSVPKVHGLLNLEYFTPLKLMTQSQGPKTNQILDTFQSIKDVLVIEPKNLSNISDCIEKNEKFIILMPQFRDQFSTFFPALNHKINCRVFKHRSSQNYLLGKGLDFIQGIVLDGTLMDLEISKDEWIELKYP